jgi:hypothetical protein
MSVTAHQHRCADNLHDRPAKWPCPLAMGCRMWSGPRRDDGFQLEFERLALYIEDLQAFSNRFYRGGLFMLPFSSAVLFSYPINAVVAYFYS